MSEIIYYVDNIQSFILFPNKVIYGTLYIKHVEFKAITIIKDNIL